MKSVITLVFFMGTFFYALSQSSNPYYFSVISDENDYCEKIMKWVDQVVNGYADLQEECFRKDFYIEKPCILVGFDYGTYYKPTHVIKLYKWFENYSAAYEAFNFITTNFSKCEGKSNVFINGKTGIDDREALVLHSRITGREIKKMNKRNTVTFQLIHKKTKEDYPAAEHNAVGYYVYFESRLE